MSFTYRPWGEINWLLDRCDPLSWTYIGCLGPEERALALWKQLYSRNQLAASVVVRILDPVTRFSERIRQKVNDNVIAFKAGGGQVTDIVQLPLFASGSEITALVDNVQEINRRNIIVDISTFPKRYFFPIIKKLMRSGLVTNLIVAYTAPARYNDEPLAEDFDEWRALPLFGSLRPDEMPEIMIVNVGHLPMGLPDQVLHGPRMDVTLLFPFPNMPSSYRRTWEFVRALEQNLKSKSVEMKQISPVDVSDAFDHIRVLTEDGRRRAMFAPYGPKPVSLAMCLYAMLKDDPVYYTQPRCYHPDYSIGVQQDCGRDKILAYIIKQNGTSKYLL